jgi:peptide/nickel transport system substrate-binding protein
MNLFFRKTFFFFKILWKKLSKPERVVVGILVLFLVADLLGLFGFIFSPRGNVVPEKGGVVVEGVLGQPKFINPLYAKSEADKVLSSVVFSGLVSLNQRKEIVPLLSERWEVSESKKDYKFFLKKDQKWQDGTVFNAEDILYTVAVLQNPDYTESLKSVWDGIAIEKIDDFTVVFHLPKPYPLFLENLTLGILPRHLWVDIPVKEFANSSLNINAIGMGPYKVDTVNRSKDGKIDSIKLAGNSFYLNRGPYIENMELKFYDQKSDLLKGFSLREFSSFGLYSFDDASISGQNRGYNNYSINLPQYVALFINQKHSEVLSDKSVRQAMAYALDKKEINKTANFEGGSVIDSPILPGYLGADSGIKKYTNDIKGASTLLSQSGWVDQDNDGIKEKNGLKLVFDILTLDDPQFIRVAEKISEQLAKIGVKINIKKADNASLEKDYISNRGYDILLVGENLGSDPDPYSFWHSSQANYPGLNLANYTNGEVDKLLEEARQSSDTNVRIKDYKKFQEIIADEVPAIFLYQPVYVYKIYNKVRGVDLSGIANSWDRFYDVADWYVKYQ